MLIICAGMMRSGSTLQYQIVSELIESKNLGTRIGYIKNDDYQSLLSNAFIDEKYIYIAKTHTPSINLHELVKNNKVKIFYTFRDIRDSWLSVKRWQKFDVDTYQILRFIIGCIMPYYWITNYENIYSAQYEKFYSNIENEVKSIADYLRISITESDKKEISNRLNPENQKKIYSKFKSEKYKYWQHPKHLLNSNHIYSASTGEWKSELNEYEINLINTICEPWLKYCGYEITVSDIANKNPNFFNDEKIFNLKKAILNLDLLHRQLFDCNNSKNVGNKNNIATTINLLSESINSKQEIEDNLSLIKNSRSWRILEIFQKIVKPFCS